MNTSINKTPRLLRSAGLKLLLVGSVGIGIGALWGCSTLATDDQAQRKAANKQQLSQITQNLSSEHKARHSARNPVQTLAFFGIQPGDTVVEALPGGGWYSQILVPYLGAEGRLIGVDYAANMWPNFSFGTPEFINQRKQWPAQWQAKAQQWGAGGHNAQAYTFDTLPQDLSGQVDAVLFIRALHNLARFSDNGDYLKKALAHTYRMLKPKGVVGIVQHAMAEDKPNSWATGSRGYLKRSAIISFMTQAGFEFVAESPINQNINDNPQEGDVVWRLPPSLRTDEAKKAANKAIGESNRVTLLFRKP